MPTFDKDLCAQCSACVSACPSEAITLDDNDYPVIDESKCEGSGQCVDTCPTEALKRSA
jgi:ferredoxin